MITHRRFSLTIFTVLMVESLVLAVARGDVWNWITAILALALLVNTWRSE